MQINILDCVSFGTAEGLTTQFTVHFCVCCVQKGEAYFVYISTVDKTILCSVDACSKDFSY